MNDAAAVLQPGHTCWRVERASRAAVLIDGEDYFAALRQSLLAARREVLILGWDFDGRIELLRDDPRDGAPNALLDLLNHCTRENPDLHVRVLLWDFAVLYAFEREPLPSYSLRMRAGERVRFEFDDTIPFGGSHHQKVVVVDDRVAYAGGLDLTDCRRDSSEHRPDDERRTTVLGRRYGPFHDVQMVVEGDAAKALGDLARERWKRATGETLSAAGDGGDRWPEALAPGIRDVDVGIARTVPPDGDRQGVNEVEALLVAAVAAARDRIYMENQYFTSERLADALGERLADEDGPEVVLVMPRTCAGWLEEGTMGTLRGRFLRRLEEADRHARLAALVPVVGDGEDLMVHAKVCVIDDRVCIVGSSNNTKRSMGTDTECNLAVESRGDGDVARFVAGVRDRLLGEHLGMDAGEVREALASEPSMLALIRAPRSGRRRLEPVEEAPAPRPGVEQLAERVGDPPAPLDTAELVEDFRDTVDAYAPRVSGAMGLTALAAVVVGLALAWQYTPLSDALSLERAREWLHDVRGGGAGPLLLMLAYVVAGLVAAPITVVNAATVIVFGPWLGFVYAMSGSLLGAAVCFWLGRLVGARPIRRLSSGVVHRVASAIGHRGFLSVLTVRLVPVAPFTVINLVAGALPVRFVDFMLGTLVGMLPGTAVLAAFGDRVEEVMADPSPGNLAALALVLLAWIALGALMHRVVERLRPARGGGDEGESAAG